MLAGLCAGGATAVARAGTDAPRLTIAATVPPLGDLAFRVAGPGVAVTSLIPPGSDDETYEPAAAQIAALEHADLVLVVGHPAIGLEERLLLPFRERHPETPVLRLADDVPATASPAGAAPVSDADPHLWLSPAAMGRLALRLGAALDHRDAAGAPARAERLAALARRLERVEATLRALATPGPPPTFVVVHPAFGALARDFGIQSLALERDGKEPGLRALGDLVAAARARRVRWVVTQPGFSTRLAETVASELGARTLVLDPLAADWLAGLERLAAALARGDGSAE